VEGKDAPEAEVVACTDGEERPSRRLMVSMDGSALTLVKEVEG